MRKIILELLILGLLLLGGCSRKSVVVGKIRDVKGVTIEHDFLNSSHTRVMAIFFEDRPAIFSPAPNYYPDMKKFVGKTTSIVVERSPFGGLGRGDYYQKIISMEEKGDTKVELKQGW